MSLVWKESQAVPRVLRLAIFILLSLGVHLLIFQISIPRQIDFQRSQEHGVGYVSRSVKEFVVRSQSLKQMTEAPVPKVTAVAEAPQKSQNKVPQKISIDEAASVKEPAVPKPESARKLPKPVLPVIKEKKVALPATPSLKPVNEIQPASEPVTEALVEPIAAPELSKPVEKINAGGKLAGVVEESQSSLMTSEDSVKNYQEALPRYDINPLPKYPEVARRRGQEGTVTLEVLVLADGRVGEMDLVASSGYRSLDKAALKAVRRWQFKPATSLSAPVESRVLVPVDFILNDN